VDRLEERTLHLHLLKNFQKFSEILINFIEVHRSDENCPYNSPPLGAPRGPLRAGHCAQQFCTVPLAPVDDDDDDGGDDDDDACMHASHDMHA
jgi:hypothetical protein